MSCRRGRRSSDLSVKLGPGGRKLFKATVSIPDNAVRGERYGVVWAEMAPRKDSEGVINIGRVGIRLYVSTGPGGTPSTHFDIGVADGPPRSEQRAHRPGHGAQHRRASSRSPGVAHAVRRSRRALSRSGLHPSGSTLGIGDTQSVQVPLHPRLPGGPWRVKLTLTSGVTTRTAEATLSFPLDGDRPRGSDASSGLTWWAVPVSSVLGLGADRRTGGLSAAESAWHSVVRPDHHDDQGVTKSCPTQRPTEGESDQGATPTCCCGGDRAVGGPRRHRPRRR